MPDEILRALLWLVETNKEATRRVQPWVRGRSAGSFPEQRLEIEPTLLIKPMRVQNQARSGFPRFIASAINRSTGLARLM